MDGTPRAETGGEKMRYPTKIIQSYKLGLISRAVFVELWRQWQTVEIARQAILNEKEKIIRKNTKNY